MTFRRCRANPGRRGNHRLNVEYVARILSGEPYDQEDDDGARTWIRYNLSGESEFGQRVDPRIPPFEPRRAAYPGDLPMFLILADRIEEFHDARMDARYSAWASCR